MIGYIYLTKNEVNEILYIGKRQKPKFEKCYKGSGKHLKLAFEKYGKEKFHTEVLEWCSDIKALCEAEKKWIKHYKDLGYELYNITEGGEGACGISWRMLSPEKQAEILRKNSEAHKGKRNGFFGKHHSEEVKNLLREKNKKNKYPKELKAYKEYQRSLLPKIAQIDKNTGETIKIWDNWCSASKVISPNNRCGYSHIGECCRHERKSAYGYRWEFV